MNTLNRPTHLDENTPKLKTTEAQRAARQRRRQRAKNPEIRYIPREQAVLEILQGLPKAAMFSARFIKRTEKDEDGNPAIRTGTFKLSRDMQKGKTGRGMSYSQTDKGLIGVYDMQKQDYRSFGIENLMSFRYNGVEYRVQEERALFVVLFG